MGFTGSTRPCRTSGRWAFSDLRDNTVRGVLAEFIVDAALGRTATRRKGWDNYDVQSDSGVKVEVKASGYLQSWAQAKHSRLDFGRVAARSWDENTNDFGAKPRSAPTCSSSPCRPTRRGPGSPPGQPRSRTRCSGR
jgi:hypothetical protein